jgi:hypothetical protein
LKKNTLYAATATPAAMTSCHSGMALPVGSAGKDTPSKASPRGNPADIATTINPA